MLSEHYIYYYIKSNRSFTSGLCGATLQCCPKYGYAIWFIKQKMEIYTTGSECLCFTFTFYFNYCLILILFYYCLLNDTNYRRKLNLTNSLLRCSSLSLRDLHNEHKTMRAKIISEQQCVILTVKLEQHRYINKYYKYVHYINI